MMASISPNHRLHIFPSQDGFLDHARRPQGLVIAAMNKVPPMGHRAVGGAAKARYRFPPEAKDDLREQAACHHASIAPVVAR